jgi:hypothetical protein
VWERKCTGGFLIPFQHTSVCACVKYIMDRTARVCAGWLWRVKKVSWKGVFQFFLYFLVFLTKKGGGSRHLNGTFIHHPIKTETFIWDASKSFRREFREINVPIAKNEKIGRLPASRFFSWPKPENHRMKIQNKGNKGHHVIILRVPYSISNGK